jgi:hypothetical protein
MKGIVLMMLALQAPPTAIRGYMERISLEAGGAAFTLDVTLSMTTGIVSIPLARDVPSAGCALSSEGAVTAAFDPARRAIQATPTGPAGAASVRLACDLPGLELPLAYRLVSGSGTGLSDFDLEITLPPGQTPLTTHVQLDPTTGGAARQPVEYGLRSGRRTVRLRIAALPARAVLSFRVDAEPSSRGPIALLIGIILGAGYLYRFRDLVTGAAGSTTPTEAGPTSGAPGA